MRPDMAKVIVERPRLKGNAWRKPKGYARGLARYGEDGPPAREGIKHRWHGGGKYLNEHLGPLRRYLDSQVGRPWDKVHSEICARIDRGSAVQDHVRDHVEEYVVRNVLLVDGVPCNGEGGWGYGKPLHETRALWFVCPRTGLLRRVKHVSRKRRKQPGKETPPAYVRVSDLVQCLFIEGAWHLVTLKPLPTHPYHPMRVHVVDVVLNKPVCEMTHSQARRHYGAEVYAVARRKLSHRELRHYPVPDRWWGKP